MFEIKLPGGPSNFAAEELSPVSAADHIEISRTVDHEPVAPPLSPVPEDPGTETSLLIVEDNEQLLALLAEMFSDRYTVHTAVNGRQGLEMAEKILPDIILTDS